MRRTFLVRGVCVRYETYRIHKILTRIILWWITIVYRAIIPPSHELTAHLCIDINIYTFFCDLFKLVPALGQASRFPRLEPTETCCPKMGKNKTRRCQIYCWSRNSFAIVSQLSAATRVATRRDDCPDATFHWLTIIKQFRFTLLMGILWSILRLWMELCLGMTQGCWNRVIEGAEDWGQGKLLVFCVCLLIGIGIANSDSDSVLAFVRRLVSDSVSDSVSDLGVHIAIT